MSENMAAAPSSQRSHCKRGNCSWLAVALRLGQDWEGWGCIHWARHNAAVIIVVCCILFLILRSNLPLFYLFLFPCNAANDAMRLVCVQRSHHSLRDHMMAVK